MSDDRERRRHESRARPTARDVPFVRGTGSESEPAPRGQRPGQLPRDPTYEAELAQVELAVLRDPAAQDPSTKQGGRRGHELPLQPPESVTPESPGTRAPVPVPPARAPMPSSSGGRAVASGTLLSAGAVDPRGKTERTLETPRMFFSNTEDDAGAYFKPGKIPAVTVHQTIETETVKLADSIDPRRAKTMPRIDRAALSRYAAEHEPSASSAAPTVAPASEGAYDEPSPEWEAEHFEPESLPSQLEHDGQTHASLSLFREQGEPSFSLDGAPTRPEPLAARRASEPPSVAPPDPSAVPTQRDLPAHRSEGSCPPPPVSEAELGRQARLEVPTRLDMDAPALEGAGPVSEGPRPTTASISAEEPAPRPLWVNLVAFALALGVAVALGLWLTAGTEQRPVAPNKGPSTVVVVANRSASPAPLPVPPEPAPPAAPEAPAAPLAVAPTAAAPEPPAVVEAAPSRAPAPAPTAVVPPAPPRKSPPSKPSPHETIF